MNVKLGIIRLLSAAVISCSTPSNLVNTKTDKNVSIENTLPKNVQCGIYRSKWVIPSESKLEYQRAIQKNYNLNTVSNADTVDAIMIITEYSYYKRYGEKEKIMSAHNAADALLAEYIKDIRDREINYTSVYLPYIDESLDNAITNDTISGTNNVVNKNNSKYETRKAAVIYVMVGSTNLTHQIINSLKEYK